MTTEKTMYKADKVSGITGTLYALSIILGVVRMSNIRNKYHFPFYALTFDIDKSKADEWFDDAGYEKVCDQIMGDIKREGLGYFEGLEKKIRQEQEEFKREVEEYIKDLSKLDDGKLLDRYTDFVSRYVYHYSIGAISFIYEQILSERLSQLLAAQYDDAVEMIEELIKTDFVSFMVAHEGGLHKIKKASNRKEKEGLAKEYIDEFFYIKTSYADAPELTLESVIEEAEDLREESSKERNSSDFTNRKLSEDERLLVGLFKITEVLRDKRKQINLIGGFAMFRFLDELVRRTGILFEEASRIYWFEFGELLQNKDVVLNRVKKRKLVTAVCPDGRSVDYLDYLAVEPKGAMAGDVSELRGTPAAKGKARGKVRVVIGRDNFTDFKEGEVLVAEMTRPNFVPLMKKAAAIVTDEGSLTCHAAVVSRELGIPCVVGVKIATQIFKDGDVVEVDANHGVVKVIKKA